MLRKLSQLGVEVRAVEQPIDMSIPENQMMLAFFLAIPEVENARRSLEIKKGQQRGITEGRWMGLAPYGYKNKVDEKGIKFIEPVEMQARIMRFAFQELSTGLHTTTEVFHHITEYGFNKSINCFWKAIRNPVYCGKITAHREGKAIMVQGQHQGIISDSLFSKVQQILNRKKVSTRNAKTNDILPLRGLLICPVCHRPMTGSGSTGKDGTVYYYYHCRSLCHVRFPVQQVHDQLKNFLYKLYPNFHFEQRYQEIEDGLLTLQAEQQLRSLARAVQKVEKINQRLPRLDNLLLEGNIEPAHYKILKQECEAEIELLRDAVKLNTIKQDHIHQIRNNRRFGIKRLGELYEILNAKSKRELVSYLFPFGITYKSNCFALKEICESFRVVFEHHVTIPRSIETEKAVYSEIIISNENYIHKLAEAIQAESPSITLKQSKEIATFFINIAQLNLAIEITP